MVKIGVERQTYVYVLLPIFVSDEERKRKRREPKMKRRTVNDFNCRDLRLGLTSDSSLAWQIGPVGWCLGVVSYHDGNSSFALFSFNFLLCFALPSCPPPSFLLYKNETIHGIFADALTSNILLVIPVSAFRHDGPGYHNFGQSASRLSQPLAPGSAQPGRVSCPRL